MPSTEHNTFALQHSLGLFCRTGVNEPVTSIQEHTVHYRRLVFNVVKDTLKTAFPLSRNLAGKKKWRAAVAYFFEQHNCQTPQVWRLPQEFQEFYQHQDFPSGTDCLMLRELLQYEWLETEVFMMEDLPVAAFKKQPQDENDIYVPNPEIKILALHYPIHTKDAKHISETDKGQYFVSIHRDYETKQVRFNDLSYPFVELLVTMNEQELTKTDLIRMLMRYESNINTVLSVLDEFEQFAFANTILLGYKTQPRT
ncbi:MAG TPA: putative DNA-binding domain-containing protein [Chitinophagaceae bacterium]|nr:putative DNA-binding domain-containing protein [Chitinophagaceae bacterium]